MDNFLKIKGKNKRNLKKKLIQSQHGALDKFVTIHKNDRETSSISGKK